MHRNQKIYEYFTSLTIVRGVKRSGDEQASFTSLDDLKGEVKESFMKICQLAFDMTKKSVQTVSQENTKIKLCHAKGSDSPTFGLIIVDSTARLFAYEDIHIPSSHLPGVFSSILSGKSQNIKN